MKYVIYGKPDYGRLEQIDEADDEPTAVHYSKEYRTAFGSSWAIWWECKLDEADMEEMHEYDYT